MISTLEWKVPRFNKKYKQFVGFPDYEDTNFEEDVILFLKDGSVVSRRFVNYNNSRFFFEETELQDVVAWTSFPSLSRSEIKKVKDLWYSQTMLTQEEQ